MTKPAILVVPHRQAELALTLESEYDVHRYWQIEDHEAFLAGPGKTIRAILVGGPFVPPVDFLDRLPQLGLIACVSAGFEGIDLSWCRTKAVSVTTGQGANADDVADHTLALILARRRRLAEGEQQLRSGSWIVDGRPRSRSMAGARIGIVGMGAIGTAVARRLEFLRAHILWWGPTVKPDIPYRRAASLHELAVRTDMLVIACRADASTRGMIDEGIIQAVGPDG
jgi:lactate dehydrogenase-like 2-hydroxyacid dehydrogenase